MKPGKSWSALLIGMVVASAVQAEVRLPAIFSDNMVLQRSEKVPIWGKADPGEEVTVTLDGKTATAMADGEGRWIADLNLTNTAAGPFHLMVRGKNTLAVQNVLVGEVWLASGQSNMAFPLSDAIGGPDEIARTTNAMIRMFTATHTASPIPLDDNNGSWAVMTPVTSGSFSAVAYFFARRIQSELGGPVGIIHASWGGTPSEAWTSAQALDTDPELKEGRERWWNANTNFAGIQQDFVANMGKWIADNDRADIPSGDFSSFNGPVASTDGWCDITFPGKGAGNGLPMTGIVWLRLEFTAPDNLADILPIRMNFNGLGQVFLNGILVGGQTLATFEQASCKLTLDGNTLPAGVIKPGANVLAVRIYQPSAPVSFSGVRDPKTESLAGPWRAKVETAFKDPASQGPKAPEPPKPPHTASYLFQGMINPILPYAIRGAIWYQGESNSTRAMQYRKAFPLMIRDWRHHWQQGEFPFYFCQLANYRAKAIAPTNSLWAELREAQSMTLTLTNTSQAVLVDIGESGDIHPRNKKDAGERLARIALARDYGKAIPYSGPVYDSMVIKDDKMILSFKHADGGLVAQALPETFMIKSSSNLTAPLVRNSPSSELEGFAICGADRQWAWADARIDGDKVIVWSPGVAVPVAVRYGWADNPTCNLYNGAGLPASPFRTDNDPGISMDEKY